MQTLAQRERETAQSHAHDCAAQHKLDTCGNTSRTVVEKQQQNEQQNSFFVSNVDVVVLSFWHDDGTV